MKNIKKHNFKLSKVDKQKLHNHKSHLFWFTGLSGSGKSTLANLLEQELYKKKISTFVLDGDGIRLGLNKDLGFSSNDRSENIRRIAEVAHLFLQAGIVVLAAFVSPFEKDRMMVKKIVGEKNFTEIFVNAGLEICKKRDTKGLYEKAQLGLIKNMTGLSSPYEIPIKACLQINTDEEKVEVSALKIKKYALNKLNYGKLYN